FVWGTTLTAGAGWTSADPLWANAFSDTVQGGPVVTIAPDGTATAAWVRNDHAGNNIVQFATKSLSASAWPQAAADDSAAGANDLSLRTGNASGPAIAVDRDGTKTIAYSQDGTLTERTRPAGAGVFNASTTIPNALSFPSGPTLISSPDGGMV